MAANQKPQEMSREAKPQETRTPSAESKPQDPANQSPTANRQQERGTAPYQRDRSPERAGRGWAPMAHWRDEFDRLFDQLSRGWLGIQAPRFDAGWGVDIREDDNTVMVRAEAPGFEPDDFDIQVRGDQLTLCATHKTQKEEKEGEFREWRRHDYFESVTLPSEVNANNVKANYRHGVLSITLPKSEETKARRVKVEG